MSKPRVNPCLACCETFTTFVGLIALLTMLASLYILGTVVGQAGGFAGILLEPALPAELVDALSGLCDGTAVLNFNGLPSSAQGAALTVAITGIILDLFILLVLSQKPDLYAFIRFLLFHVMLVTPIFAPKLLNAHISMCGIEAMCFGLWYAVKEQVLSMREDSNLIG
ncbi:hypothetical protein RTBOTA2_001683 [Rhodotorula toruloides]|uniref:FGENESH: predicted gene_7.120 protein n=1 Tax=Rhodotorula toruloides TaxID=5286 RepID=A0A0K3CDS4_RHOTO|nr:hypothetical protein RTBOTA2_001683 [Rhodotorula toruloides]